MLILILFQTLHMYQSTDRSEQIYLLHLCQCDPFYKGLTMGSITAGLTTCLFCLESAALLMLNEQQFYLFGAVQWHIPLWWVFSGRDFLFLWSIHPLWSHWLFRPSCKIKSYFWEVSVKDVFEITIFTTVKSSL